jgi:hypothetical protein
MSFADFYDIYRICSTYRGDEQSLKVGIDMTSSPFPPDLPSSSSIRWWELVEKEIQREKREKILT